MKLSVLSDITKVRAATTDGNIIESKDLKINEELVVKAVVTPNRYEIDSAPYAVWSTSDSDVVISIRPEGILSQSTLIPVRLPVHR